MYVDDSEIHDNDIAEAILKWKWYRDNKLHAAQNYIKFSLTLNPKRFVITDKSGDVITVHSRDSRKSYRWSVNHAKVDQASFIFIDFFFVDPGSAIGEYTSDDVAGEIADNLNNDDVTLIHRKWTVLIKIASGPFDWFCIEYRGCSQKYLFL